MEPSLKSELAPDFHYRQRQRKRFPCLIIVERRTLSLLSMVWTLPQAE